MADSITYSLGELAERLQVDLQGDPAHPITGLASLVSAGPGLLTFFNNPQYQKALVRTRASAVILSPEHLSLSPCYSLVSDNPYITYARASQLFIHRHRPVSGVHDTAIVDASVKLPGNVRIGPHAVIEAGVKIGDNTDIGANCTIGSGTVIGKGCIIYPNVAIYDAVSIGKDCIVHSGVVIGADGFGFAPHDKGHIKIAQLGNVKIGDNVEIGAGTTIDRGALDHTVIGNNVKIDNQVQIAHNVQVGANTVICGCSAVAGSTVIGKNCTIAGGVGIINNLKIADNVTITAMSLVNQSINKAGVYSSGTSLSDTVSWKRNAMRFKDLESMEKRLRRLERSVNKK